MGPLGLPELLVIFVIAIVWVLPIAAAIWALVTLQRLRVSQQAMAIKVDNIELLVQARQG